MSIEPQPNPQSVPYTPAQNAAFAAYMSAKIAADDAKRDEIDAYWRWAEAMGWVKFTEKPLWEKVSAAVVSAAVSIAAPKGPPDAE